MYPPIYATQFTFPTSALVVISHSSLSGLGAVTVINLSLPLFLDLLIHTLNVALDIDRFALQTAAALLPLK
jgi:hypothetical protein